MSGIPKKHCSYVVKIIRKTWDDTEPLEYIAELGGGILIAFLAVWRGVANRSELHELIFIGVGCVVLPYIAVFLFRSIFMTPYKMFKEIEDKFEIEIEKNQPKFKLSCDKHIQGCAVMNDLRTHIFLRALVETQCVSGIENCVGHLTKIEKDGVVIYDHDPRALPFAPSTDTDSLTKTIFPNNPYFLDVLVLWHHQNYVLFATKTNTVPNDKNGEYIFKNDGQYILTVSVSGKNVPTELVKLKLDWKSNWQTAGWEKLDH
jgi:hypothetical protein